MEEKKCTKCGSVLPLEEFPANKNSKDGHSHLCKRCLTESKSHALKASRNAPLNPERPLAKYSPRQLMEELRLRGYDGELTFVQRIRLSKI